MCILETKLWASDLCRNLNPLSHFENLYFFFLKICFCFFNTCVCACVFGGMCACKCRCSWGPEESIWFPGPGVTCSCEQKDVGIKMWILYRNGPCSYPQCNLSSSSESYLRPVLSVETQCDPYNAILNDFMSRIKRSGEKQSWKYF